MRKPKIAVALSVAGIGAIAIYELQLVSMLRKENRGLRAQVEELRMPSEQVSRPKDRLSSELSEQEKAELLRLRGQVGVLKRELAEAGIPKATTTPIPASKPEDWTDWAETPDGQKARARMEYSGQLMLSLIVFADKNGGRYPTNFDAAIPFLSDSAKVQTNFAMDQFELLFHGKENDITNGP